MCLPGAEGGHLAEQPCGLLVGTLLCQEQVRRLRAVHLAGGLQARTESCSTSSGLMCGCRPLL